MISSKSFNFFLRVLWRLSLHNWVTNIVFTEIWNLEKFPKAPLYKGGLSLLFLKEGLGKIS
ncbi:hypothetical protein CDG62_17930 [Acinetobacter sp. WCHA55]|nr:hypothetical protein CDG62_17930 [Acinetobacter sp. WCHA55]